MHLLAPSLLHNQPSNYKLYAKTFTQQLPQYGKGNPMNLIVASNKDPASLNIKEKLLKNHPFQKTNRIYQQNPLLTAEISGKNITLATLSEESVHAQYLQDDFSDAELIVFISRHSSQSGTPTLTVHVPGNFGAAELGGLPKTVSTAPAVQMQTALKTLAQMKEKLSLNYEVSYEVTHHGPSLEVPAMFVELGSSPLQWSDQVAALAVATAAISAITSSGEPQGRVAIGIGGTHYNQKFSQLALQGKATFGHMIPKYAIKNLDLPLLLQCIQKTQGKVCVALIDWKGIQSQDKPELLKTLKTVGVPCEKV
jgi:D-aminoacyl-tRNA deacylase